MIADEEGHHLRLEDVQEAVGDAEVGEDVAFIDSPLLAVQVWSEGSTFH